jgi:hypothetical protein
MPLTLEEYEKLVYDIPNRFPSVRYSTLVFIRLDPLTAVVRGESFSRATSTRELEKPLTSMAASCRPTATRSIRVMSNCTGTMTGLIPPFLSWPVRTPTTNISLLISSITAFLLPT